MEKEIGGFIEKPMTERKVRPQKDEALNCPRCHSTNTKFCYYNNYSLTQPRYFCKACRRYWTQGGSLRNVPVGGGSRKNKRSATATVATTPIATSNCLLPDLNPPTLSQIISSSQNTKTTTHLEGQDLNLAAFSSAAQHYPDHNHNHVLSHEFLLSPKIDRNNSDYQHPPAAASTTSTSTATRGLNSFIQSLMPNIPNAVICTPAFHFQDLKPPPVLGFSRSADGPGNRYELLHGVLENNIGRPMFPIGQHMQLSSTNEVDRKKAQGNSNSSGYWNGMLGGRSW